MEYYVYIVRCEDGSLYTGITTDLARRMAEHLSQEAPGAKYTRTRKVARLEVAWRAPDRSQASVLEYKVKGLRRSAKLRLIEEPRRADEVAFPKFEGNVAHEDAPGTRRVFEPLPSEDLREAWRNALER